MGACKHQPECLHNHHIQHVILCFLDPNRREKELVLHHGNALHQVRPGTGDGLGMVEEVWLVE